MNQLIYITFFINIIIILNNIIPFSNSLVVNKPCCSIYPHADAMFGAELDDAGITGKLTVIDPPNGCTDEFPTINLNQSIALIPRGTCSFGQKVFYAQMSAASAVIIFNNNGDDLIAMSAEERYAENVIIPAAFVGESTGLQLLADLKNHENVIVTINKTDTKQGPPGLPALDSQLTLIMFEAITVMWCLIFLCYIMSCVRKCCKVDERKRAVNNLETKIFYRSEINDDSDTSSDNDDFDEANGKEYQRMVDDVYGHDEDKKNEDVDSQNSSSSKKKNNNKSGKKCKRQVSSSAYDIDNCVICLEDFNNGDKLTVLPCGHEFHKQCIRPWLLTRSTLCPICKMSVVKKDVDDDAIIGDDNENESNGTDDIESQSTASNETSLLAPLRGNGDDDSDAYEGDNMDENNNNNTTSQCCNNTRVRNFARMGTIVTVGMILTGVLVMVVLLQLTGE